MLSSRLLASLAWIAGSVPALCQTSQIFPPHERVLWDQPSSGSFGTTEIARLNLDHGNSVFVLRQNQLVMAYAPHVHEYLETVATTAYGFAVRRGTGPNGLDQIIYSDDVGLKAIHHDTTGTSLYQVVAIPGATSLAGSKALTCTDLDGNGTIDIAGADSTGNVVRTLIAPASGPLAAGPTIYSVATVRELEPIEWSASPGFELAIRSDAGCAVYNSNGTGLQAWLSSTSDHSMTVLKGHDTLPDRLVIAQRDMAGVFKLNMHDFQGSNTGIDLGSIEPVNLDAGYYDDDELQDVAMNYDDGVFVRILTNVGGVLYPTDPMYSEDVRVSDYEEVLGGGGPNDTADPCLADIDDDGFAEVIMGSKSSGTSGWIAVREAPPEIESDSPLDFSFCSSDPECMSPVVGMTIYNNDTVHDRYSSQNTGVTSAGTIAVDLKVENMFGEWNETIYNAIELVLWEQGPGASAAVSAVSGPAHHVVYNLTVFDAGDVVEIGFSLPGVLQDDEPVSGGAEIPGIAIPNKYYAEVRLVLVDEITNEISDPLRTYVVGFTGDLNGSLSNGLFGQILQNTGACQCAGNYEPEYSGSNGGGDPPDGTYIGGFAPLPDVPPLTSIVPQSVAFLDASNT